MSDEPKSVTVNMPLKEKYQRLQDALIGAMGEEEFRKAIHWRMESAYQKALEDIWEHAL